MIGDRRPSARPLSGPSTTAKRPLWSSLVTVLVVPGLFATAALPAYASSYAPELGAETVAASSQGRSFVVSAEAAAQAIDRSGLSATSEEEMAARLADPARASRVAKYLASGAVEAGDDYPWYYMAADYEGGGLSPLGYYYRECVDFVAWRLNRDAGSTEAPFKYTWPFLTPGGGDARQWASNWKRHGWPTGKEPVVGSVAWFPGNHVAYVKEVFPDGSFLIEEYNHGMSHAYGQRILEVSDIALFLYAPPR